MFRFGWQLGNLTSYLAHLSSPRFDPASGSSQAISLSELGNYAAAKFCMFIHRSCHEEANEFQPCWRECLPSRVLSPPPTLSDRTRAATRKYFVRLDDEQVGNEIFSEFSSQSLTIFFNENSASIRPEFFFLSFTVSLEIFYSRACLAWNEIIIDIKNSSWDGCKSMSILANVCERNGR